MNKKIISLFVILVLGLFIAGCSGPVAERVIGPAPEEPIPTNINANACSADTICEVNNRIQSSSQLYLTSQSGAVKIEGDLTLTKLGQSSGVIFETNDVGSLTITPGSGSAKINGGLIITEDVGMTTLNVNGWSDLEGDVSIGQELMLSGLTGNGNAYACINSLGKIYRSQTPCV